MSFDNLDDYSILCIFSFLKPTYLGAASQVCKRWNAIANDDLLWKQIFCINFGLDYNGVSFPPGSSSWKKESQRLSWICPNPKTEPEILNGHFDEVNHVAFSADGEMFATCGNDCQIIVWSATDHPCKKLYYDDLSDLHWQSAQYCQFNNNGTLLLVSGILLGDKRGRIAGEIVIFSTKEKFRICSRISNRPFDTVGCWFGNNYVISSEFKWLSSQMVSATMLWMNKVSFALESNFDNYLLAGMRTLYKLYSKSGNAPRQFLVANRCRDLSNKVAPVKMTLQERIDENVAREIVARDNIAIVQMEMPQLQNELAPALPPEVNSHFIKLTPYERYDLNDAGFDENRETNFKFEDSYYNTRRLAFQLGEGDNDWIYEDDEEWIEEEEDESSWEYWSETDQPPSEPEFLKVDEGWEVINESEKLLIFSTGTKTWVPHQVGIKRMSRVRFRPTLDFSKSLAEREAERKRKREEAERRRQMESELDQPVDIATTDWSDYPSVSHQFDCIDYLIEMHGRVMGLELSPCSRYLHINVRPWPSNYNIPTASQPPPMGATMNCHVLDLSQMIFVGQRISKQISFMPAGDPSCTSFNRPSVTKHFIGDVDDENYESASLWDRHYGIKVSTFQVGEEVNCVALRPQREDLIVVVSKDAKVKLWRSKSNNAQN